MWDSCLVMHIQMKLQLIVLLGPACLQQRRLHVCRRRSLFTGRQWNRQMKALSLMSAHISRVLVQSNAYAQWFHCYSMIYAEMPKRPYHTWYTVPKIIWIMSVLNKLLSTILLIYSKPLCWSSLSSTWVTVSSVLTINDIIKLLPKPWSQCSAFPAHVQSWLDIY